MTNYKNKILPAINSPADLRQLSVDQLPQVCDELREFIIDELSTNPGHFASSLGSVELTVALHYVFDTPDDRIVWDVGHQAYGHKILTGRRDSFGTNRKKDGLSGFPNPEESPYDTFTAGHASNSISAALGMAIASNLSQSKRKVVAVIGDGAMSGGLAFEGLNNASGHPNNLLIILNDNNMSIDRNVGGMNQYLVDITTSRSYNKMRYDLYRFLRKCNIISEDHRGAILRFNNSLKALLTRQQNIFDGLNIRYFGPVDGHDVRYLVKVLNDIKEMGGPKLLHVRTIKGKGYAAAEKEATIWHAPGCFNKETGERYTEPTDNRPPRYQDVFGQTLVELAEKNPRIVGITPAMPTGSSMCYMMQQFPERSFDVGIAEEHAVTFSGGLAKEGLQPFCSIYSTFLQRAYDQVIHDIAIQKLPVVFCLDRAGLVGEDGCTHQGAFDLAAFNSIPNLILASPINEHYLRHLMFTAQNDDNGPFMIRYPRGRGVLTDWRCDMQPLQIGKGRKLTDGADIALITLGPVGNQAALAAERARQAGLSVAHYDMIFLKPADEALLTEIGQKYNKIVTVEDGAIKGGLGSTVTEFMADRNFHPQIKRLGIPDHFIAHAQVSEQQELCGFDTEGIVRALTSGWLSEPRQTDI